MNLRAAAILCTLTLPTLLTGCGGAKLVRNPPPPPAMQALAVAADDRLAASLDFVIVRNGPGAWAKNGDWDEYLLRVRAVGATSVQVLGVEVVDSLGRALPPAAGRKALVKASREQVRRYRDSGLKVRAGLGGAAIAATGIGAGLGAGGIVASGGGMLGGVAGAATFFAIAPAFGVAGIVRAVNNSKVDKEIRRRQTALPQTARTDREQPLDLFFPLAPSPSAVRVTYSDGSGEHVLEIDTRAALSGLHLRERSATAP
jgi:hypothetical protein